MSEPAWVPLGALPSSAGVELAYGERTTDLVLPTSGVDVITLPPITVDGGTPILVEASAVITAPGSAGFGCDLFDGAVNLGKMLAGYDLGGYVAVSNRIRLTPSAGAHTYKLRGYGLVSNQTLYAGPGSNNVPATLKVSRVGNPLGFDAPPSLATVVTALPATAVDGQEIILVDSLTAPTFSWRLRYVAAKATNRWVFTGGSAAFAEVATVETINSTAYADAATPGPSLTAPVTGLYELAFGCFGGPSGNVGARYMSPKFGAATALDADAALGTDFGANGVPATMMRTIQRTVSASTVIKMQYRQTLGAIQAERRWFTLRPVAVGG